MRNAGWGPTALRRMRTGGGGKPPPYTVGAFRPIQWFWVRTSGGTHRSRPTRSYEPSAGGAEGPLALSPQQCEAWIEGVTAPIQSHRTKSLKNLKIPKLKSFTRFFSKNRRGPGGSAPGRPSQRAKSPRRARRETPAGRSQRNTPGGGLPYCSGSQKLRFRSTPPSMPETVPSLVYCHIWKS